MSTAQPGRRRGRSPGLSRELVARAALGLADRDGIDRLSMPVLARALGVGTMTLYGYVRDKADLLDAVVDVAVTDMETPDVSGLEWRPAVEQVVLAVHELLTRHPAVVAIRLGRPVLRPDALQFGEFVMGRLLEAGLPSEQAASSFRLIFTYVFGSAALSPGRTTDRDRAAGRTAFAELDPDVHPVLTLHADSFARAMSGEDQFRFGLSTILDGIAAALADRRAARRAARPQ